MSVDGIANDPVLVRTAENTATCVDVDDIGIVFSIKDEQPEPTVQEIVALDN